MTNANNNSTPPPSENTEKLIRAHLHGDTPYAWFEKLYADAFEGDAKVPWARFSHDADLELWLKRTHPHGEGKTALVVGCGLGDDAELLAHAGYQVTAFDVSETAIHWCKRRFRDTHVQYEVVDLFALPAEWRGAFDVVFESRTIQALPWQMTEPAIQNIAECVAFGGTLLVYCLGREPEEDKRGIPWHLSRADLALFHQYGLEETNFIDYQDGIQRRRFCVEYRRRDS